MVRWCRGLVGFDFQNQSLSVHIVVRKEDHVSLGKVGLVAQASFQSGGR